jgi:hypothetical protein
MGWEGVLEYQGGGSFILNFWLDGEQGNKVDWL